MELDYSYVRTMLRQGKIDEIVQHGKDAVPALITAALEEIEAPIVKLAIYTLDRIKDISAVPALITLLGHRYSDISLQAVDALEKIGQPAVTALINALEHTNPNVREYAIRTLGGINERSAGPALIKALVDADPRVRNNAAWVLGIIKDKSAVSGLIKALVDGDRDVRGNAARALGKIGNEREIMFKRIIYDKELGYVETIGLEKVKEVMKEFIGMLWKDCHSTEAGFRIKKIEYKLAEFYNKVADSIAKKGKGISIKDGELLRDTVKPPNGNNGIYRTMQRAMRLA